MPEKIDPDRPITGSRFIDFARDVRREMKLCEKFVSDEFWRSKKFWDDVVTQTGIVPQGEATTISKFALSISSQDLVLTLSREELHGDVGPKSADQRVSRLNKVFKALAESGVQSLVVRSGTYEGKDVFAFYEPGASRDHSSDQDDHGYFTGQRSVISLACHSLSESTQDILREIDSQFDSCDRSIPPTYVRTIKPHERTPDVLRRVILTALHWVAESKSQVIIGIHIESDIDFDELAKKHGPHGIFPRELRVVTEYPELLEPRNQYAGIAEDATPLHSGCVLISQPVHQLVCQCFATEAVGEFRSNSQRSDCLLYRVWHTQFDTAEIREKIREEFPLWASTIRDDGPDEIVRTISVNSDFEGQIAARWVLHEFKSDSELYASGTPIVLHWQCAPPRNRDLLAPVSESLRWELGLNRRNHFLEDNESRHPLDSRKRILEWVQQTISPNDYAVVIGCLEALMLGGIGEHKFVNIVSRTVELLQSIHVPLRIVVENVQYADEVLLQVLCGLNCRIKGLQLLVICTKADPDPAQAEVVSNSTDSICPLSQEAHSLARIAAVLGWDTPLSWLRNAWKKLCASTSTRSMRSLIDELFAKGILEPCGVLFDHVGMPRQYREVKFVSSVWYAELVAQNHKDRSFVDRVIRVFSEQLLESKRSIPEIRKKIRVFELLQLNPGFTPEIKAELGLILGRRAMKSEANAEACRRLLAAWDFCDEWQERHGPGINLGEMRCEILSYLIPTTIASENECDKQTVDRLASGFTSSLASLSNVGPRVRFAYDRAVVVDFLWNGKLANAALLLSEMKQRVFPVPFHALVPLEVCHLAAVVAFQRGNLVEAVENAVEGRLFCENNPGFKLDDEMLFGKHDGRVCCKLYEAMGLLLQGHKVEADQALFRAYGLLESLHDSPTSCCVGAGYTAFYFVLQEDFEAALNAFKRGVRATHEFHWNAFSECVREVAEIGKLWKGKGRGENVAKLAACAIARIGERRARWRISEYQDVWTTFQATAHALAGAPDDARKLFEDVLSRVSTSEEKFFQPEFFRLFAWFEDSQGDHSKGAHLKSLGIEIARQMNACLFLERLRGS